MTHAYLDAQFRGSSLVYRVDESAQLCHFMWVGGGLLGRLPTLRQAAESAFSGAELLDVSVVAQKLSLAIDESIAEGIAVSCGSAMIENDLFRIRLIGGRFTVYVDGNWQVVRPRPSDLSLGQGFDALWVSKSTVTRCAEYTVELPIYSDSNILVSDASYVAGAKFEEFARIDSMLRSKMGASSIFSAVPPSISCCIIDLCVGQ